MSLEVEPRSLEPSQVRVGQVFQHNNRLVCKLTPHWIIPVARYGDQGRFQACGKPELLHPEWVVEDMSPLGRTTFVLPKAGEPWEEETVPALPALCLSGVSLMVLGLFTLWWSWRS